MGVDIMAGTMVVSIKTSVVQKCLEQKLKNGCVIGASSLDI